MKMTALKQKHHVNPKYGFEMASLKTRLNFTKQIYATKAVRSDGKSQPDFSGRLHRVQHSAPDFVFRSMKGIESERSLDKSVSDEEALQKSIRSKQGNKQKEASSKSQISVKLEPLKELNVSSKSPEYASSNHVLDSNEEPSKLSPYSEKVQRRNFTQTNFPIFNTKPKTNYVVHSNDVQYRYDKANMPEIHRSKTLPPGERIRFRSVAMIEMERRAKIEAQKAIREKKIFSIIGPYPSLRMALRRRGWVEKFQNSPSPAEMENKKKTSQSNYEPSDDYDKQQNKTKRKEKPWEEENGYYGLMSYLVRNSTPTFVFTVKTSDVNSRVTKSNQLVNHYNRAKHFTTKSGLCLNLRSVIWYEKTDPYTFYPRSYKTDDPEEKNAFIDDYRWTACVSFVRSFAERYKNPSNIPQMAGEPSHPGARHPRLPVISVESLELAIQQLEKFLQCRGHKDIDDLSDTALLSDGEWQQFISSYYLFVHEGCDLSTVNPPMVQNCQELLEKVKANWPQYEIDGVRNVWILKPGALSRGRGIQCLDTLDGILKVIDSSDNSLVIQKYIERPLLIYETKFDIRQWFLVTDWNPLTVWIYKDNYLRFCSREFTLQDFNPVIHLSNNSITKNAANGPRSEKLPEDNMWTSDEFVEYLGVQSKAHLWKEKVMPGIKNAIICSLLCTQELIEGRKSAFELYGADFMLTEDFQPWLLEINVSPSMAQTTHATSVLVDRVLEDMIKVVLDRRYDRTSSTGRFELAFKQQQIRDPPPVDQNLIVHGRRVRNKYNKSAVKMHEKSPSPKQERYTSKSASEKS